MVLAMQYLPQFYNFCFQSTVMEVVEGLNSGSTVLSSKKFYLDLSSAYFITLILLEKSKLQFSLERFLEL